MSNYPPGVSGNEFAIAGPDYEREYEESCPACLEILYEYGYKKDRWVTCLYCDYICDLEPLDKTDPRLL